jgi:hypothetical protein
MNTRKGLILLASLVLLSFQSISQTVTRIDTNYIFLEAKIARLIVLDLEELDLLRQETSIHTDMMAKLQSQVLLQHDVISAKDSKIENLNKIIKEKDVLIEISEKEKTVLKSKIKKSYLIGALSGGAISTLLFLLR